MKILHISRSAPYDEIDHAGGKTLNYYIKRNAKVPGNEIILLTSGTKESFEKCDCEKYGIRVIGVNSKSSRCLDALYRTNIFGKYCAIHKYGYIKEFKNCLIKLEKSGYIPDIIIMEWTQSLLLIDILKKIYPNAKYVASEHDVYFQGLERKAMIEKNYYKKIYRIIKYKITKIREITCLRQCNLIFTHNKKDKILLSVNGISPKKIETIVPFYDQYNIVRNKYDIHNFAFFGAMRREENYGAAIWFIRNVLPKLKDQNYKFFIVGSNPPQEVLDYASDKVIVTGYVKDIAPYLEQISVGVVPLLLGAGIKVKVLEFVAAGIPVITNSIGIEGIPLIPGKEYIHCETANEYVTALNEIFSRKIDLNRMARSASQHLLKEFSLDSSGQRYCEKLQELVNS